uniref:Uncharacterized protein n=1 Tax=viral metagenome TaxID=1070528 RepID=A0A6M3XUV5_9ZZZZ
MSFATMIQGTEGLQFEHTADKRHPFGVAMVFTDGREFAYGQAGASNLDVGKLAQQAVVTSGHTKGLLVAADAAIGATAISITNATSAITKDMYKEGVLFVNDAVGEGYQYKIKSHPAESTGTGTCVITLVEYGGLRVALTTASRVGLRKHICDSVLVAPTTITGVLVGATVRAMTALYYGWFQVKGMATVLTNGVVVVGEPVTRSVTTPGAVDPYNEDGTGNHTPIGEVLSVASSTEYSLIDLNIR